MKRILSLFLILTFLFSSVSQAETGRFRSISDPNLLTYLEADFYQNLVTSLDTDEYFVENVEAVYLSQEYLDELEFNSKVNVFFGYTLAELDAQFQGQRYIFTLGENNRTVVKPLEEFDDTYYTVLKNMAIGTGVILICITVSAVSGGIGAPTVSMIFSVAAKSGTIAALSGSTLGGVCAGIVTGFQTGDMNEAMKSAALSGSTGFKWGAISGTLSGAAVEAIGLKLATAGGLTMNEAAMIQHESKYPLDVIMQFQNIDQYQIARNAGLRPFMVDNKMALIRDIDLSYVDELGRTNMERMMNGLAALDPSGQAYQLHHIGQQMDSTLAILTQAEHTMNGNDAIWHTLEGASQINRNVFSKQRAAFWKNMAQILVGGL